MEEGHGWTRGDGKSSMVSLSQFQGQNFFSYRGRQGYHLDRRLSAHGQRMDTYKSSNPNDFHNWYMMHIYTRAKSFNFLWNTFVGRRKGRILRGA